MTFPVLFRVPGGVWVDSNVAVDVLAPETVAIPSDSPLAEAIETDPNTRYTLLVGSPDAPEGTEPEYAIRVLTRATFDNNGTITLHTRPARSIEDMGE